MNKLTRQLLFVLTTLAFLLGCDPARISIYKVKVPADNRGRQLGKDLNKIDDRPSTPFQPIDEFATNFGMTHTDCELETGIKAPCRFYIIEYDTQGLVRKGRGAVTLFAEYDVNSSVINVKIMDVYKFKPSTVYSQVNSQFSEYIRKPSYSIVD